MLPLVFFLVAAAACFGDAPPFDLVGPKVDVHVQRAGKTLPIAEVPNLLPNDRLWIHPDLPESQSTHYVLIVAFLRGATNPPPPEWFRRVETWNKEVREEGVFVVVPAEAQQALIFLAPETTGDFNTLRKAVHDRPGAFVRAAQDLQQASWDRLRLDAYLAQVKSLSPDDPKALKEGTELAARSLGIRVEQQCFDKPTEQQAPCLTQHPDGLVLDDSNAQSIVNQMANGSAADMMNQLSYAPMAGAGAFSPYVGAIVDMAQDSQQHAHCQVPVHSGTGAPAKGAGRYAELAPQRSTFFSRPQIGNCGCLATDWPKPSSTTASSGTYSGCGSESRTESSSESGPEYSAKSAIEPNPYVLLR
jgi:hypothetical protein